MFCHEAYAEVSDQVDDALSGSYHFMTWFQQCSRFCPVDPAKTLGKIRSAIGRDRAGTYSFTIGMAEATMLHHLEAEQAMWNKIKGEFLSPLVDHVNVTKRQKESIDKKMRLMVTKIHTGKRKLAAEKKSIVKDLEEYYACLRDPDNNARKIPGLKKKLSAVLSKYETAVKDLATIEKEYRDNIPNQMKLLHDLEQNRLTEVQTRLQTLSQVLFERCQDMVESRSRLESYISSLPSAQAQHDQLISKWMRKFKESSEFPLVAYDLPVTYLNIETAQDISNINAAEEVFEQAQQKLTDEQRALTAQLNKTQNTLDDEDATELAKFNQQAQVAFQAIMKTTGTLGIRDNSTKRNLTRQESVRKPMQKVAPLTRTRMTVVERPNDDARTIDQTTTTIAESSAEQWLKLQDPDTHDWYYENMFTGETTLEEPEGFVDSRPAPSTTSSSSSSSAATASSSSSEEKNGASVGADGEENALPFTTDGLSQEEKKRLVSEAQKLFMNANIMAPDRFFVRRGMLTKKCRSRDKDYDFFLFNDLLLWANKSGKKFKVHKTLNIDAVFKVHDMPPKPTIRQEFAVQSVDKSFVVMVDNFTEKCGWLQDINACYQLRKSVNSGLAHLEVAPVWKQDAEKDHCPQCKRNFTAFRRKHHCRKCGELRCADCCSSKVLVRGAKPERVCSKCNPDSALAQLKKQQTNRGVIKPPLPKNPVLNVSATQSISVFSATQPIPTLTNAEKKSSEEASNSSTNSTATGSANTSNSNSQSSFSASTSSMNRLELSQTTSVVPIALDDQVSEVAESPPQYIPPAGVVWIEAVDDVSGVSYYYNTITKTSTWIRPAELDSR